MNKILVGAVCILMSCAVCTGCGKEIESNKDIAASSVSANKDNSGPANGKDKKESEKTLTEKLSEKMSGDKFYLSTETDNELTGKFESVFARDKNSVYSKISYTDQKIEMYVIDKKSYMLDEANKEYYISDGDGAGMSQDYTLLLPENAKLVDSKKTKDGLTCETYNLNAEDFSDDEEAFTEDETSSHSGADDENSANVEKSAENVLVLKYYFDAKGNIKKLETTSEGETTVMKIKEFKTDNFEIKLPDLSKWKKINMDDIAGDVDIESDSSKSEKGSSSSEKE